MFRLDPPAIVRYRDDGLESWQAGTARDGVVHRCVWLIQLRGRNPNTGEDVDEHGCAMAWVPILLIENSQQQRSTAAAVESFRNEMIDANAASAAALTNAARAALEGKG